MPRSAVQGAAFFQLSIKANRLDQASDVARRRTKVFDFREVREVIQSPMSKSSVKAKPSTWTLDFDFGL
jgi:hypothetical protein